LPAGDRERIAADLRGLAEIPIDRPPRVKRLKGLGASLYRLRSGDHRVLYRIDGDVVTVMRVVHRRDLERALRRLGVVRP
jgi:mRNA-degrading endonuclease RelE of RelBE toxin-antitoxin system